MIAPGGEEDNVFGNNVKVSTTFYNLVWHIAWRTHKTVPVGKKHDWHFEMAS